MIATIQFEFEGVPALATLGDDLRWACPRIPAVADMLNVSYRPSGLPSRGEPGHQEAHDAARWLEGELTFEVKAGSRSRREVIY